MNQKVKVGIIGFGRMGGFYLEEMRKSDQWEVLYICDTDPEARDLARRKSPTSRIVADEQVVFEDPEVQVVGLFTLADSRLRQIKKEVVKCVENSSLFSTVNLYLRNSWYHNTIKEFIRRGEIGDLAIIRICHMTPGLAPGEGHEYEGPSFHDCGMHYVDISRWYAGCEYKTWHAQAIRMWDYRKTKRITLT